MSSTQNNIPHRQCSMIKKKKNTGFVQSRHEFNFKFLKIVHYFINRTFYIFIFYIMVWWFFFTKLFPEWEKRINASTLFPIRIQLEFLSSLWLFPEPFHLPLPKNTALTFWWNGFMLKDAYGNLDVIWNAALIFFFRKVILNTDFWIDFRIFLNSEFTFYKNQSLRLNRLYVTQMLDLVFFTCQSQTSETMIGKIS